MKLSAIVIAKNEESNIEKCLQSLKFCDEIILIDGNSSDKTTLIASKYTKNIFKRDLDNDFSGQRNFGMTKAKGDYLLFVDADEEISDELGASIKEEIGNPKANGYYIKREDILLGRRMKYGESRVCFLRMAKKGTCKWVRTIHETLVVQGDIRTLDGILIHHSHSTVAEFINAVNYYSTLHASENLKEGKVGNLFKIIFFPLFKFLYVYIFRFGFLDGNYGLFSSAMMGFHSFLAWSKLYMLQKSKLRNEIPS